MFSIKQSRLQNIQKKDKKKKDKAKNWTSKNYIEHDMITSQPSDNPILINEFFIFQTL